MRSGIKILRSRRILAVVAGMNKPNDHAEPTKSNAIKNQNQKQGYDRAAKDDSGSKELVDLRNRNTFVKYFIMVLINDLVSMVLLLA